MSILSSVTQHDRWSAASMEIFRAAVAGVCLTVAMSAPVLAQTPTPTIVARATSSQAEHSSHQAPHPVVTELMTKALSNIPGKEVLVLTVSYPPGGADPIHRHDAHGFVYVLKGSIVMGVEGKPEVTLQPGQMFHEGPQDIHTVGRNASQTEPATFLVFLLKDVGVPAVLPPH